jgi:hypothetical protein
VNKIPDAEYDAVLSRLTRDAHRRYVQEQEEQAKADSQSTTESLDH